MKYASICAALLATNVCAAAATVQPWPLPVATRAAQPNLVAAGPALYLSWIEPAGEGHVLRYARHDGRRFGPAREIAQGNDWFVNWADFPALSVLPDGSLAAHVLRKSADAPYAYDVHLTRSRDGRHWSAPAVVHQDGTPTEHGFVSLWPWSERETAIAWLDGRRTGGGHGHGHGGGGAMTLRAAVFGNDGKREEWELDASTCDCCQTDTAQTAAGAVLVYRDRAEGEIRDIAITRYRDGAWTAPARVHADGWFMPACPVNGPAVAAQGREVYVAWYTAVDDVPQLRLARSDDDGATFTGPLTLATGSEVQGRVDLGLDGTALYVSWLSEDAQAQTLWLARYSRGLRGEPERVRVATLPRGRGTGFPRLALREDAAYLVWTDIVDRAPQLRGARVRFD